MIDAGINQCVHCNICKMGCTFLSKYHIDLEGFSKRPDLAYHCFLCGECKRMCPKHLDGRSIALSMRKKYVNEQGAKAVKSQYRGLCWEKDVYKFSNYRGAKQGAHGGSVIFMGCNFPAFFPHTTKKLAAIMKEKKIGVIYDCCGKPIEELGLEKEANYIVERINMKLKQASIEEVIMICPNCYYFLKDKMEASVVSIYDKLHELRIGIPLSEKCISMYHPCPDRDTKEFAQGIHYYINEQNSEAFSKVQCCGLGGCAARCETDLAHEMAKMPLQSKEVLYTYCASCISNFKRKGVQNAYHILPVILGVNEDVPQGVHSILNRAICKVK